MRAPGFAEAAATQGIAADQSWMIGDMPTTSKPAFAPVAAGAVDRGAERAGAPVVCVHRRHRYDFGGRRRLHHRRKRRLVSQPAWRANDRAMPCEARSHVACRLHDWRMIRVQSQRVANASASCRVVHIGKE
jgi:hypothetical protein